MAEPESFTFDDFSTWIGYRIKVAQAVKKGATMDFVAAGRSRFKYVPVAGDKLAFTYRSPKSHRKTNTSVVLQEGLGLEAITDTLYVIAGHLTLMLPDVDLEIGNSAAAATNMEFGSFHIYKPTFLEVKNLPTSMKP